MPLFSSLQKMRLPGRKLSTTSSHTRRNDPVWPAVPGAALNFLTSGKWPKDIWRPTGTSCNQTQEIMRIILFYHSLLSDWNHGNAHFLRGYAAELQERGHDVFIYEPSDGWSLTNLVQEYGEVPIRDFREAYPRLQSVVYHPNFLNLDLILSHADLVIVHEWNDPELVERIGRCRQKLGNFCLLFHDTHHRSATNPMAMAGYNLTHYDGVLAFGETVRQNYLRNGWANRVWTWHEAADTRIFYPRKKERLRGDLIWVGNWGDDERTAELQEFLLDPVADSGIRTSVFGVRY